MKRRISPRSRRDPPLEIVMNKDAKISIAGHRGLVGAAILR